jgi:putative DNA methylase
MSYRKKLIEVALPLAAINAESAREKSIRHGHPSTLHLWWARRPLAACRAVLFASLVDDPDSDPQYIKPDGSLDEEAAGMKRADLFNLIEELVMWENSNNPSVIRSARAEIARCVASRHVETGKLQKDSIVWPVGKDMKLAPNEEKRAIKQGTWTAWDLVTRGHCKPKHGMIDKKVGRVRFSFDVDRLPPEEVVNAFLAEYAPPALDPFAGGGSIPMEAQRLGLIAHACDLNPIPVLINKATIEIPPRFVSMLPVNPKWQSQSKEQKVVQSRNGAYSLAQDIRFYGQWIRDEAENRIGQLYPKIVITEEMASERPDLRPYIGKRCAVIAWFWTRTVASPNPAVRGAHVPLIKSFDLSSRKGKEFHIQPEIDRNENSITFRVLPGKGGASPRTIGRRGGACLLTGAPIPFEYIRREGKLGRLRMRLTALVVSAGTDRLFLSPAADQTSEKVSFKSERVPDESMAHNPFSLRPPLYGFSKFSDVFTNRQLAALTTFSDLVGDVKSKILSDIGNNSSLADQTPLSEGGKGGAAYAEAISTYLAFAVSRGADYWSTGATWEPSGGFVGHTFTKQALPMVWDFCEANPVGDASGNWAGAVDWIARVVERSADGLEGVVSQRDAAAVVNSKLSYLVSTDPPYYNNVDYADLSDFFYVWLRRSIGNLFPSLFATLLTPKTTELVASQYRFDGDKTKSRDFFESGLQKVFGNVRQLQNGDVPTTVYYAFRQTEADATVDDEDTDITNSSDNVSTGWETMLTALIEAGFGITGTWPMRTERGARSMSINMNALASSIVLVCRPRPADAPMATRKEFITALRRDLPESLRSLQKGNIAPVDLAQAAIGPGMAVFSRYSRIVESDGSRMTVRNALGLINQTLDEVLAEQEGEFDSDTRWALAWFEQFGTEEGAFGDAETLSKAKNTAISGLQEAGVIIAKAGKVRLVNRSELPENWNPVTDKRLTIWEVTQHLIRRLDQQGEIGAAELISQLGGIADVARDLAYRLYSTCERKKWAQEALAYNSLVVAWPELAKIARSTHPKEKVVQGDLF